MSASPTLPASTGLEADARAIMADDHQVAPAEIAIGVVIGRMSEFFDFFVYAIASVVVFPQLVFPGFDRLTGTLLSFAVFALAFVARPVGSVVFMAIDRRHGRGVKLTAALFLLGGSTAAMAFLPGYAQAGPASVVILCLLRIGQGLALGGAWDGLASLLALNAPPSRRGWYAMIPQLGAPLGLLLACALFAFFLANLSASDFLEWGWRYPFFVAFAVNVVALFARLRLVVTREFTALLERRELQPAPVADLWRTQWRNILVGAFAPLASLAMFHLVSVFPLSWITLFTRESAARFLELEMVGALVGAVAIALSGVVADRIGRGRLLTVGALSIAAFGLTAPWLLGVPGVGRIAFVVLGFAVFGLSFGQASGAAASNFPSRFRYAGAAFSSDLAWLVGAGFAPLVVLALSSRFGLPSVAVYILSGVACTLVAVRLSGQLHIRDT